MFKLLISNAFVMFQRHRSSHNSLNSEYCDPAVSYSLFLLVLLLNTIITIKFISQFN